ncbi:MAG TPA: peptide chain release factor N(5)-glutamine methyltransferase [Paracoccaceae bacterium]|nr:peptide chain release factor N(5)-glutamine methyltransferase [Paracoccaceae bacterium]
MTRADLLAEAVARLRSAGIEAPERDARLLLRAASGLGAAAFSASLREPPGPAEAEAFAALLARRLARQPVAQILGRRTFWGRDFLVTPDVLDPRPETETLVATALSLGPRRRILDLGTGSGCLLLTLLAEWPGAQGCGIDASGPALAVARANAKRLGLGTRAEFRLGNWLNGVEPGWDLVVANPPYIAERDLETLAPEVRFWEPLAALSSGGDGLGALRRIADSLPAVLAEGGAAIVEFGIGQQEAVREMFGRAGAYDLRLVPDLTGRPRCLLVQG